ncbi:MAG TPA: twin-arginine translocase subunit TatC [Polyangiaceae bacterium]|nr:twin-arginine translocase subunit TatC [Polyangiaceae bacterium]
MTFWEHLDELRARIVRAAMAFVVGAGIAWFFKEKLLEFLTQPFVAGWNESVGTKPTLHYPAPASLFLAYVKLAMLGGLVLSLPFMLYQVWAFVAPGLYSREKRLALPFVASSFLLFLAGAYFGLSVAFPAAFDFLLGLANVDPSSPIRVEPTVMIDEYMEFVIQALLAFGLVFEIPVIVFFLAFVGMINHTHLIRFARYFVVVAFVLAAIFTPPDPLSQLLLAGPLCVLYGVSIGIAWLVHKSRRKALAQGTPGS